MRKLLTVPSLFPARWITVSLGALIFSSAACGGAEETPADREGYVLSSAERSVLLENSTPEQKFAFEDDIVTFEEYEVAVLNTLDCAREGGITVTDAAPNRRQKYSWNATWPDDLAGGHVVLEQCRQTYLNTIAQVWTRYTAPSEEELQEAREALASCLRARGVAVPDPVDRETLSRLGGLGTPGGRASPEFADCATQIQEEFALPGFAG